MAKPRVLKHARLQEKTSDSIVRDASDRQGREGEGAFDEVGAEESLGHATVDCDRHAGVDAGEGDGEGLFAARGSGREFEFSVSGGVGGDLSDAEVVDEK